MAIECTPAVLVESSECYNCMSTEQHLAAQTYALAVAAGLDNLTPDELIAAAACFDCYSERQLRALMVYLLCQLIT